MQPSCSRLLCCSRNPFSPAAVLRQHYVLPNRSVLNQLRQSSSAPAEASKSAGLANVALHSAGLHLKRAGDTLKSNHGRKRNGENNHKAGMQPTSKQELFMTRMKEMFDDTGDYKGLVVRLRPYPKGIGVGTSDSALPWCWQKSRKKHPGDSSPGNTGLQNLEYEIREFHAYMRPTALETLARQTLIENVRQRIQRVAKGLTVELFGSERTGLALATSDIDIRLSQSRDNANIPKSHPPPLKQRRHLMVWLYRVVENIKKQPTRFLLVEIRHARYPLISMRDAGTQLDVQIVLNNDTWLSQKLMARYIAEYPYLPELYTVVKTFFDMRGLSDVFRGGFGSYNIFMMIVASLKHSVLEESTSAHALINFFRFWATFDTRSKGISIEPAELYEKQKTQVASESTIQKLKDTGTTIPDFMLSLRDPADSTNDLGRKGICIKHVQTTCDHIYHRLIHDVDVNGAALLKEVVGQIFDLQKDARKNLEFRGRQIAANRKKLTPNEQARLTLLARNIFAPKTTNEEDVAAVDTRAKVEQARPAIDTNVTSYSQGEVIESAFGMSTLDELAQDEAREIAVNQGAIVDKKDEAWEQEQQTNDARKKAQN